MKRWFIPGGIFLLLLIGIYIILSFYGVRLLNNQLQRWGRAGLTVSDVKVRPTYLSITGVRFEDPQSKRRLVQIEEMRIYPAFLSVLKGPLQIRRWVILRPNFYFYRSREGDWLGPLPPARKSEGKGPEVGKREGGGKGPTLRIGRLRIQEGSADVEDMKTGEEGAHLRIRGIHLDLRELNYPIRSVRSPLELVGKMEGQAGEGDITAKGWMDFMTGDMEMTLKVRGVGIKTFEPYYRKRVSAEIQSGVFNMDSTIAVKNRMIDAPGELELADLQVSEEGTVLWIPAKTLVSLLRDRGHRIKVQFRVKGNLEDPKFNLQETFFMRVALALAEGLGIPIKVVAEEFFGGTIKGAKELMEGLRSFDDFLKRQKEKKR